MKHNWIALLIAAMALNLAACKKREKPIDPESARIIDEAAKESFLREGGTPHLENDPLTEEERQSVGIIYIIDSSLGDLRPLLQYPNVSLLHLENCPRLRDLTPLKTLSNLNQLRLYTCASVTDLRPLIDMPHLFHLSVHECTGVKEIPRAFFKIPDMTINWKRAPAPTPGPTPIDQPAT